MVSIETVQIVSDETEMGYVIINKSDFDPSVHRVYGEAPADTPPEKKSRSKKGE
jgi:hypothetical protein